MSTTVQRRFSVGAEPLPEGGTHFRVWAPRCSLLCVVLEDGNSYELVHEDGGYFSGSAATAVHGSLYRFRPDGSSNLYPDPASRFQPEGPHGPSQVVDSSLFQWNDSGWPGVHIEQQVIYEMHIGTFTTEGTWRAAERHLHEL